METNLWLVPAVLTAAIIIYTFTKAKHPVITAVKSAMCGVSALILVNITSAATGCYIAVNFFTVFVVTFLSLPGVIGLIILNIIFI